MSWGRKLAVHGHTRRKETIRGGANIGVGRSLLVGGGGGGGRVWLKGKEKKSILSTLQINHPLLIVS